MFPSSANPVAGKTARKVVGIIILVIVTAGLVVVGLVLTRPDYSPDDSISTESGFRCYTRKHPIACWPTRSPS